MHGLASSFHSSTPLCFGRASAVAQNGAISAVTSSTSKLDFNQCSSSPPIATSRNFDNNSVRVTRSRSKEAKKITSINVEEADESQKMVSSALKRFCMKELENIVQSRLEAVVSQHHYNTWLREQVDETEVQLVKYQNRIDAIQKHVNDLSAVIRQYAISSEGEREPPMKLTRNVGLQVRIKNKPDSIPVYEVEDVQSGHTSSGEESMASVDVSVSSTTTQDWPTPTSSSDVQNDQHCTIKSLKIGGQVESHQTLPLPVEIDLTELDEDTTEPTINPSTSSPLPTDQTAFLLSKKPTTICSQPEASPFLMSSSSCVTPPALPITQAMNFTADRTLPWITSDNVTLLVPPLNKDKSANATENSLMGRSPSLQPSCQSAEFSHAAVSSTISIQRRRSSSSHEIANVLSRSSIETPPSAGTSVQNVATPKKNSPGDFYSHPDRKRRLSCRISTLDASTIASVERYHKLIKKYWYNSTTHQPIGISPLHIHRQSTKNGLLLRLLQKLGYMSKGCRSLNEGSSRWKLPLVAGSAQKGRSTQHPPPPKPQTQQQFPKELNSGPPPLIGIHEESLTRETCTPDLHNTSPPLLKPVPTQQERHTCESLTSHPDGYPAQLELPKSDRRKRNLPDLIAISNEGMASHSHNVTALKVYDLNNFTMFKPVLKLTRSEEGIQIEWTIPMLPPDQLNQIESYLLYSRKENDISPSMNTPWFKAAVISALPLPMCFKLTELTPGYRYHFQIGPVLRWCQSDIPFSNPVSINE
ncbi:uncharacterized protein LOC130704178 [Daphnia carinata]|uniref:uncharacterized protein LOC130704178 n=1 Tax=Daphnia carinata TaxID=120202 RepID=UPI002868CA74|nr:uncharacterized protein LOC130704178 [Daphnia carinata]